MRQVYHSRALKVFLLQCKAEAGGPFAQQLQEALARMLGEVLALGTLDPLCAWWVDPLCAWWVDPLVGRASGRRSHTVVPAAWGGADRCSCGAGPVGALPRMALGCALLASGCPAVHLCCC